MASQIDLIAIISPKPGKVDRVRRPANPTPPLNCWQYAVPGRGTFHRGLWMGEEEWTRYIEISDQSRSQQEIWSGGSHFARNVCVYLSQENNSMWLILSTGTKARLHWECMEPPRSSKLSRKSCRMKDWLRLRRSWSLWNLQEASCHGYEHFTTWKCNEKRIYGPLSGLEEIRSPLK